MEFSFETALPVLHRTPAVFRTLLADLPDDWTSPNEGPGTWSAYDVVGHMIHGERTDWIPRVEHILAHGDSRPFVPFDREAMFKASQGQTLAQLLDTFDTERASSLARLHALNLTPLDFQRKGLHPTFGMVTMGQLLATWVVHDLTHINQVVRVMARQYGAAVGPWTAFLSVLTR